MNYIPSTLTRPVSSWKARISRKTFFFSFNDTATTEIYTLSLHDALPISSRHWPCADCRACPISAQPSSTSRLRSTPASLLDRKSTRLNSSHQIISYAVFCLKKKIDTERYPSQKWQWLPGRDIATLLSALR